MHPQLEVIRDDFNAAQARLHKLVEQAPEPLWSQRANPARWSMAECLAHVNLTSAAFVPLFEAAIEDGRRLGGKPPRRYRRDLAGRLFWKGAGPPVRFRVPTTAPFIPSRVAPLRELVAEFDVLQERQLKLVSAGEGLPLERLWIRSPFNQRIRYNCYACFSIQPRHQHRHLWQAEQVLAALSR